MGMKMGLTLALALSFAASHAAANRIAETQVIDRKVFQVVNVDVGIHDIRVTFTDSQQATISTVTDLKRQDAETFKPSVAVAGNQLNVVAKKKEISGNHGGLTINLTPWKVSAISEDNKNYVDLKLPKGVTLKLKTRIGDCQVIGSNSGGPISCITNAGDIKITSLSKDIQAQTDLGDIEVNNQSAGGKVNAQSHSGDITAKGRVSQLILLAAIGNIEFAGQSQMVKIKTDSGSVQAEGIGTGSVQTSLGDITLKGLRYPLQAHSSSGDLSAEWVTTPKGKIDFTTAIGDVNLSFPAATRLSGSLKTDLGDIDSDWGSLREGQFGGTVLYVRANSGNIELRKR